MGGRRRGSVVGLAVVLGLCTVARPDESLPSHARPAEEGAAARQRAREAVADEVVAAVGAGDAAVLTRLASVDEPDPWLVAEVLGARGRWDAAERFASAAPRADLGALPAHLAERRSGRRPSLEVSVERSTAEGAALLAAGKARESAAACRAAAEAAESVGWLSGASAAWNQAARSALSVPDYLAAAAGWERARAVERRRGRPRAAAYFLGWVGNSHALRGAYADAIQAYGPATAEFEAVGDLAAAAGLRRNAGNVHLSRGEVARALAAYERALQEERRAGEAAGAATTLANLGVVHEVLGNEAKALETYRRALEEMRAIGDRGGVARVLWSLGRVEERRGNPEAALEHLQRALEESRATDPHRLPAGVLRSIGDVRLAMGDYPDALAAYERALESTESAGERREAAESRIRVGAARVRMGDPDAGLDAARQGTALAEEIGAFDVAVEGLRLQAEAHLAKGNAPAAVAAARGSVAGAWRLLGGLADEQGARARGRLHGACDVGARAALALADAREVSFFLESGRGGSLLEGLGVAAAVREARVPLALRELEAKETAREAVALAAYRQAVGRGDRVEIRARRAEVDAARDAVQDVVERMQREARAAAAVLQPAVADLARLSALLRHDETLVVYGLLSDEAVAVVVTERGGRLVRLGPSAVVRAAGEAVVAEGAAVRVPQGPDGAVARLRTLVLDPLEIGPTGRRLIVSPDGVLAYVPFALLAPGHQVTLVPSGTTLGLLAEEQVTGGGLVLGVGDPEYGSPRDGASMSVYRPGGGGLPRLPATRDEVRAIADTVLLGSDATEEALRRTLPQESRWRAVHFACHGLVDAERPSFSSLALTPSGSDDGFLTVLDLCRLPVPTDLVVLSACETGKGKIVRGEGLVGLARAFVLSGASRVLCSLWKVDDAATRSLMVRFYDLWHPKDGSKGLGAAAALRVAQEHVRSQPAWKEPRYWAAWVLWGLPE